MPHMRAIRYWVALRKESVDRNWAALFLRFGRMMSLSARRAWIEIANICFWKRYLWSLSARRAWIEMTSPNSPRICRLVALRKESVDRNKNNPVPALPVYASLSARRAWIEILTRSMAVCVRRSLSARRAWIEIAKCHCHIYITACRSPQGERG